MPGRARKPASSSGKLPPRSRHDARAFQKVSRPRVVSQPRPFGHDIGVLGGGKILNPRPARRESVEIVPDGGDGGLLKHDLRQPDGVRVGSNTIGQSAGPTRHGKIPGVGVVPGQQGGLNERHASVICLPSRSYWLTIRDGIDCPWTGERQARRYTGGTARPWQDRQSTAKDRSSAAVAGSSVQSTLVKGQLRAPAEKRGICRGAAPDPLGRDRRRRRRGIALPLKITYGRGFGGTLVLLTTGAHAPVLEMRGTEIVERVNACYGYRAVSRVQVTQTAPTGFAEGQVAFRTAPRPGRTGTGPGAPVPGDTRIERDRG
jgi:hypothetical protein